jgi:acetate kinase
MKILVLNAGSSSQKSCLYELTAETRQSAHPLWKGLIDWTHQAGIAELSVKTMQGVVLQEELPIISRQEIVTHLLSKLWQGEARVMDRPSEIDRVGHRVVHGGADFSQSVLITPAVKTAIAQLSVLAPVHNPANLEGIETVEQILGTVPQIAVFDTAFHQQMPPAAKIYPIPYEWYEKGVRRYGFHGISHRYVAGRAAQILGRDLSALKLITCHLGNGCSLAAIQEGRSIDTTMGFTPLEGLMMGSRSGSIDPGILFHLMRNHRLDIEQLDEMLNHQSGLKGVSGVSGDMRQIQASIEQGHEQAKLALEIYVHRLRSLIGSMLAVLGGLDAIVFTGGIGEHSALVRSLACEGFEFLGLQLDLDHNAQSPIDADIAIPESSVRVLVVHTEEDWAIAQECWQYPM